MIPLKYNTRNLIVRWKTTLLTAFGFMLVVALLVVMLAFVNGLDELTKKTGPDGNVIILKDGANDEVFSDIAIDDKVTGLWMQKEVKREGDNWLASQEVYSIATQELPAEEKGGRPRYRFLQIRGVEDPAMAGSVHNLKLKEGGRWFTRQGNEVVMGEGIARTLGLNLGDIFQPRPELQWEIVGILDSRGSPFDSETWAKREEVGRYFGKDNQEKKQSFYTSVVVRTKNLTTAEKFAKELQDRNPDLRIHAMTEKKYYEEMSKTNQVFMGAAIFIAIIMAIGGAFGLMNTMFAAVSQRIKDIGVLRVLGYSPWQILMSFLIESLLLAAAGGLTGLLIGYGVNGIEQTGVISSGQGGGKTVVFKMVVNQSVLIWGVSFTLLMGALGGILPSLAAMRLKPLDAMR